VKLTVFPEPVSSHEFIQAAGGLRLLVSQAYPEQLKIACFRMQGIWEGCNGSDRDEQFLKKFSEPIRQGSGSPM
jgi:hypothetical protein